MSSRWFNLVVVFFWLTTMSWLVVVKVMPPIFVGSPPDYHAVLKAADPKQPAVCWKVSWNGQSVGWAASRVLHKAEDVTAIHSRVFLHRLPLQDLAQGWIATLIKPMVQQASRLTIDAQTLLDIDPAGRLADFKSKVKFGNMSDDLVLVGQIDGAQLRLTVRSGGTECLKTERYWPSDALMEDEFSPQSLLPGLRMGQRWTVPVYSPFHPGKNPVEILQATVEQKTPLVWNGMEVAAWLVVYRADAGSGLLAARETRGKLWVNSDGLVLKQEMTILNSHLTFNRLTEEEGRDLSEALGEDLSAILNTDEAKRLLSNLN